MPEIDYYFDANATTPLSRDALGAWVETSEKYWHNPSSLYPAAAAAKQRLEDLRGELAELLGCDAERVIFTSGATEANNAVFGSARHLLRNSETKVVLSAIEHPSVADSAERFFPPNQLHQIGVTNDGVFDLRSFEEFLEQETAVFVSLMAANNETGVLQPWREVAEICREKGIPFHCDAAQWIGKLPLDELVHCDYVTASAHKFGGPRGVGFLLIPESTSFQGQIGGPQEGGYRGGTENLPAIAAMVTALKNARLVLSHEMRDQFERDLAECLEGVRFLGADGPRLGNTSMFVLPGAKNLRWLTRLGQRGIAVSTGSACSAGRGNPSRVMRAMGCGFDEMGRVLRVSALADATSEDWEALLDGLLEVRDELNRDAQTSASGIRKISLEDL